MADRLGRRRLFQLGLVVFALISLLGSLAPNVGWLIGCAALQGVGGSMLNPIALSIVVGVFADPAERARAIGIWGSAVGLTIAIGPVLGGLLVNAFGWRSVYWFTVPVALIGLLLARLFVPESKASRARRFDLPGQLLIAVLFASVVTATFEGAHLGWSDVRILGLFALAGAVLTAFIVVEYRRADR